jgi:hypothetical protein
MIIIFTVTDGGRCVDHCGYPGMEQKIGYRVGSILLNQALLFSSSDAQGNIWNQVEQDDADLVKRYPGEIDCIELLGR